jgi:predicted nuclease of predicted toxin-antitoxin system
MKGILIDENLPFPADLPTSLPVVHARQLGEQVSDSELWVHAGANELVIVTKDADFSARVKIEGPPPRIVHLRVGNMRRAEFLNWFFGKWPLIEALIPSYKLIDVFPEHMELIA